MIMVGIHHNKAYCRVHEFAEELGIATTYNSFKLHEMKSALSPQADPPERGRSLQLGGSICAVDQPPTKL